MSTGFLCRYIILPVLIRWSKGRIYCRLGINFFARSAGYRNLRAEGRLIMNKKEHKTVLITGCSSGFGLLSAVHLASLGYEVYATMRNLAKRNLLDEKARERNIQLHVLRMDVTEPESIHEVIAQIEKDHGRLDVLLNNAGYGIGGFFGDISDAEYRAQMETNFFGVIGVTRAALPLLHKSDDARIINISSTAGLVTTPGMGAYNASKWAVEAFSESLRLELLSMGIKVFLIEPGPYPTEVLTTNTRFAANSNNPESPYYKFTMRLYRLYQDNNKNLRSDPMDIPRIAARLIRGKNPPFRNITGPTAKLRAHMHRFLPWRLYEWIIRMVIFGPSNSKV